MYSLAFNCKSIWSETTLVALSAFGIKNLSMSEIFRFSPSGTPYLNVISSGCLFLAVIFTMADNGLFTITSAAPGRKIGYLKQ